MQTDDQVRTGRQAAEDVMLAMVENGLVDGMKQVNLATLDDVEQLYAEIESITSSGQSLFIYRISREVSQRGRLAGAALGILIGGMPQCAHGKVMISFDGYADDPRELHEVSQVVDFCQGMVLGNGPHADNSFAKATIPVLLDEVALHRDGFAEAFDLAGRIWVVATAFAESGTIMRIHGRWAKDVTRVLRTTAELLRVYRHGGDASTCGCGMARSVCGHD